MFVNMTLKDGTVLNKCAIYEENPIQGQHNITDKDILEDLLRKVPYGKKYVAFQNKIINGHVHVNNITSYNFVEGDNENERD